MIITEGHVTVTIEYINDPCILEVQRYNFLVRPYQCVQALQMTYKLLSIALKNVDWYCIFTWAFPDVICLIACCTSTVVSGCCRASAVSHRGISQSTVSSKFDCWFSKF